MKAVSPLKATLWPKPSNCDASMAVSLAWLAPRPSRCGQRHTLLPQRAPVWNRLLRLSRQFLRPTQPRPRTSRSNGLLAEASLAVSLPSWLHAVPLRTKTCADPELHAGSVGQASSSLNTTDEDRVPADGHGPPELILGGGVGSSQLLLLCPRRSVAHEDVGRP